MLCSQGDLSYLLRRHRLDGLTERAAFAGFYFHEHDGFPLFGNQVYLPRFGGVILTKDLVALFCEIAFYRHFPFCPNLTTTHDPQNV